MVAADGPGLASVAEALRVAEAAMDRAAMRRVVKKRQERMRGFFDEVAGRLGKDYVPGKSWKSLVVALLRLLPPMTVADLGAGDGSPPTAGRAGEEFMSGDRDPYAALRLRDYRHLLGGSVLSSIGSEVQAVARAFGG